MFIDYVTLLLVNMAAGLFLLSFYMFRAPSDEERGGWAVGFAVVGLVSMLCGLHLTWTWPLQGSYNVAFGEMSVLFGATFLGLAFCNHLGKGFGGLGVYTFVVGLAAIVLGAGIASMGMTKWPVLSGVGFALSGLTGLLLGPALAPRRRRVLMVAAGITAIVAAVIWAFVGYLAYWMHLQGFQTWKPDTVIMRQAEPPPEAAQ